MQLRCCKKENGPFHTIMGCKNKIHEPHGKMSEHWCDSDKKKNIASSAFAFHWAVSTNCHVLWSSGDVVHFPNEEAFSNENHCLVVKLFFQVLELHCILLSRVLLTKVSFGSEKEIAMSLMVCKILACLCSCILCIAAK